MGRLSICHGHQELSCSRTSCQMRSASTSSARSGVHYVIQQHLSHMPVRMGAALAMRQHLHYPRFTSHEVLHPFAHMQAKPRMQKSSVVDNQTGKSVPSQIRTSTGAAIMRDSQHACMHAMHAFLQHFGVLSMLPQTLHAPELPSHSSSSAETFCNLQALSLPRARMRSLSG